MKSINDFYDSALAMIADLERSHNISFTPKESQKLQISLAEISFCAYCGSKFFIMFSK